MSLLRDVWFTLRALSSARGFFLVAVLTLGAGLTLATMTLAVMQAYGGRGLPYPASDRIHRLEISDAARARVGDLSALDWASLGDAFDLQTAWDLDVFYLLDGEYPQPARGAWITPDYTPTFGLTAALGRTFTAEDFATGSPPVALISDRIWRIRFGADPAVLGRTFRAYVSDRPDDAETFTIVGVLPADLWHLHAYTEVLTPLKEPVYPYIVRLRTGFPAAAAGDRVAQLLRGTSVPVPAGTPASPDAVLVSLHAGYIAAVRPVLIALGVVAALMVIIATANVIVLALLRARVRAREMSVRLALGATRWQAGRLLVLEGVVVGGLATAVGLAAAAAFLPSAAPSVERFLDRSIPGGIEALALDSTVVIAVIAAGAVVTALLAALPLLTMMRRVAWSWVPAARGATESRDAGRSRAVFIAVEVAASLTLVAGASLMTDTALRMLDVELGLDGSEVATTGLALRQRSFPDQESRAAVFVRLQRQLREGAGVSGIALGDWMPLATSRPRPVRSVDASPAATTAAANRFSVTGEFFDLLDIPLRDGRTFVEQDGPGGDRVAIVSESLARRLWPGARAVGQRIQMQVDDGEPDVSLQVVGVAGDVRASHADADLQDVYLPLGQRPGRFVSIYLRAPHGASLDRLVRLEIARVHPELAVTETRPLLESFGRERLRPQALASMLTVLALLASLLALVGMHGVVAFAVRQREREIAVRMAIGAAPRVLVMMFVRYGLRVLAVGLVLGLLGAAGLGRLLQSQLFGVGAVDATLLTVAAAAFTLSALAAIVWPAWRASATDPLTLLKLE